MAKAKIFIWFLFLYLLFWFCEGQAILYLQIGDKCQEEKGHIIPTDDELRNYSVSILENFPEVLNAVCDPTIPLVCLAGRCQCKKGYTINRNGTRCLEVARNGLESLCEENIQCWKSLLGRMSECNVLVGRCQCYESESLPIVYHHGRYDLEPFFILISQSSFLKKFLIANYQDDLGYACIDSKILFKCFQQSIDAIIAKASGTSVKLMDCVKPHLQTQLVAQEPVSAKMDLFQVGTNHDACRLLKG